MVDDCEMAEEETQRCSGVRSSNNSGIVIGGISRSSSSASSKRKKQKKVPQRGLGVAQLEKIRQQEQQIKKKHHAVKLPPCSLSSSSATTVISTSSPSLPFSPTNYMFRHNNVDAIWQQPVSGLAGYHFSLPKSHIFGDFSASVVDHSLAYGTNNSIWNHHIRPGFIQTPQQQQQLPCSSLVNVSSINSTSSVMNFQIEPPSNQSFGSNYKPMWIAEDEKTIRLKRPYPFSQDNPPGLTINYKISAFVHPSTKFYESTSTGNGSKYNLEPSNHVIRGGHLCPSMSKLKSKQGLKDNGACNGDFLTLATPAIQNLLPNSHFKHTPSGLPLYKDDFPDVEPLLNRGSKEGIYLQTAPNGSKQQHSCYSFLSPPEGKCCKKPTTINNFNESEEGGSLDLNLKL